MTDAVHHWHPVVPALLAWILLLMPRIGVLTWSEFERDIGWTNFFVLASSLSLARALIEQRRQRLDRRSSSCRPCRSFATSPSSSSRSCCVASVPVRLLIPNITGFLATTIPIAMSIGAATGVNPMICGLAVMIAGDAVLYYPAQSASSLAVYERGYLTRAGDLPLRRVDDADRVRRGAGGRAAVLGGGGRAVAEIGADTIFTDCITPLENCVHP